jgi:hypothetical protein
MDAATDWDLANRMVEHSYRQVATRTLLNALAAQREETF